MPSDTLYEVLNVAPNASADEIRAAFRRLGAKVHPDRGGSNALFRSVKDAYDILSDPHRRAEYDLWLMALSGAGPVARHDDRLWARVDGEPGDGWGPWPDATRPAGVVHVQSAPSFVAQHFGPAVAAFGALVIAVFIVAYAVAGPVVFIAPSLLIVVTGVVALVAVRTTDVSGRRRPPVRRRSAGPG
ncbi:MAG: J domain-containing protein [Acidimicrobiales bacterium]